MVFGPKNHNYVNSTQEDSTLGLTVPLTLDPLLWQPYCYSRNHPADHRVVDTRAVHIQDRAHILRNGQKLARLQNELPTTRIKLTYLD
jgi:hypothetical protein